MSVINQMLTQLEQRGVHAPAEHAQVRAVPPARKKTALYWLLSGLLLSVGLAVWQWLPQRWIARPAGAITRVEPAHNPVAAVSAALPLAASAVAVAPVVPVNALRVEPQPDNAVPALHLSFELSSIPLPSVLRQVTEQPRQTGQVDAPASIPVSPRQADMKQGGERVAIAAKTPGTVQSTKPVPELKRVSPGQLADAEFAKAAELMQQGRVIEAIAGYEAALREYPAHDAARQALVALLLEGKRGGDAERVLQEGLSRRPEHTGFAMLLARLQVERGAVEQATATLEKSLPYADAQADFQAFFAALLQRQNRHKEAINHYQIALQLTPGNAVWLMGFGISLQAVQRNVDAREAYRRALETNALSPQLQKFVQQKLRAL
ncbi:MAG: tetratricopeptide repeat protein [Nitrosomonadales bacterium]|nr:tetratricopeptide repeat protein [Nitrosomonadales bacterium]